MSRLFWKLFACLWMSMLLSFVAGISYLHLSEAEPRPPPPPRRSAEDAPRGPNFLIPVVSGASVAFPVGLFLAWYLSRPLRHLKASLRAVAEGDFTTRVGPHLGRRRDEIVDLCQEFDAMADRLQGLIEARQRLLHDVSHELRSPLARLQVAVGLVRQNPAKAQDMLVRIERESQRLDALIGEVLTLARLEDRPEASRRERVDLIELLVVIAQDASFEAEASGRRVEVAAEGQFVAAVRAEIICRAFENVIRNAVRHTAPGTAVTVRATVGQGGKRLTVEVSDHGPGVAPDMLERIFEPFLRVGGDDRSEGGYGLGLTIARRAIESHGGRISAALGESGGLVVRLVLPQQV